VVLAQSHRGGSGACIGGMFCTRLGNALPRFEQFADLVDLVIKIWYRIWRRIL
jgi:hypothetical protein